MLYDFGKPTWPLWFLVGLLKWKVIGLHNISGFYCCSQQPLITQNNSGQLAEAKGSNEGPRRPGGEAPRRRRAPASGYLIPLILQHGCPLESESFVSIRIAYPRPPDSESCRAWARELGLAEISPGNSEAAGVRDPRSEWTQSAAHYSFPCSPTPHITQVNSHLRFKGRETSSEARDLWEQWGPDLSESSRAAVRLFPAASKTFSSHTSVALHLPCPQRDIVSRATSLTRSWVEISLSFSWWQTQSQELCTDYHWRKTLNRFLNNRGMAHTVSRNPSSDLACASETCLWHLVSEICIPHWRMCTQRAGSWDQGWGREGKGSEAAGLWLPRKKEKKRMLAGIV